jgi:hypothetical protein
VRRRNLVTALLAALAGTPATAAESPWSTAQIHGFAAQAALNTTDNRWFGPSDGTSFDFTEVAVNASARVLSRLLLAGQILARRAGAMYDGTPVIDYALADVGLFESPRGRAGLRAGRIKNPLGIYNETRDVPFTHPGIFLPQVVYFDRVRNLVLSTDGGLLYGDTYNDFGDLSLTVSRGHPVVDENVEWTYLNGNFPGEIRSNNEATLASLWYTSKSNRLKLGLSGASLSMRFHPDRSAAFTLGPGTTDILYWIASIQYSAEDWTLTAEYAREPIEWRDFGPTFLNHKGASEGYYLQATYRLRPAVGLMLRCEEGFANREDRNGNAIARLTGGLVPAFTGYSKAVSVGIRWDINAHWMVRAEYAHNQGTFVLSPRENDFGALEKYWDLFAVQAVFRF